MDYVNRTPEINGLPWCPEPVSDVRPHPRIKTMWSSRGERRSADARRHLRIASNLQRSYNRGKCSRWGSRKVLMREDGELRVAERTGQL